MRGFMNAIARLTSVQRAAALQKMKDWQSKLEAMPATASISEDDKNQMILDIDKLVNEISQG